MTDDSLATGQRSLVDPSRTYPLSPPLTRGDPDVGTTDGGGRDGDDPVPGDVDPSGAYPLEVTYDYGAVPEGLFDRPPEPGLERWAPLLPPLAAPGLGEGETPLVEAPGIEHELDTDVAVHVKDESGNPTWSQKDRLARPVVGAAVRQDARGVVVSSSGNHGGAVAAYAARAGLPCVVLTGRRTPAAVQRFLRAYGATVLVTGDRDLRSTAVDRLADRGYHPASSRTDPHTGHPYGPEGYKTIAYETYLQLDGVPGTVYVPTCFGELLYGVWKGFRELDRLGVADRTPRMVACEPATRDSITRAVERGEHFVAVDPAPTAAYSIKATTSNYRSLRAIAGSDGHPRPVAASRLAAAGDLLARGGHWQEDSGAAGVAGLLTDDAEGDPIEGPVVCIATASGLKDGERYEAPEVDDWDDLLAALEEAGLPA